MIFVLYRDRIGEYRWKLRADNKLIIVDSGEGYKNKADAVSMIDHIMKYADSAEYQDKS